MNPSHLDHVTIRVPDDRVDDVVSFYGDTLGFGIEDLDEYRAGERPIFAIRLNEWNVVHVMPTAPEAFAPADERNFDHFAIVVEESLDEIRETLEAADAEIEQEFDPKGATGVAPGVYVRDPFGYRVELKTTVSDS